MTRTTRPVAHPDAPAGKAAKYARPEREHRFLLAAWPPGAPQRQVRIVDRYLAGTRLRLRSMTDVDTGEVQRKLAQKIPADDGGPGLITNVYLSEAEYVLLEQLPAAVLSKVRTSVPPFGVDVFEGPLTGLVLAEIEFEDDAAEASFVAPSWALAEVTRDERFTGGRLATTSAAELRDLLRALAAGGASADGAG